MKKWKGIACTVLVVGTVLGAVVVTDPIEENEGWLIYNPNVARIGTSGFSATAGSKYFKINTITSFARGGGSKDIGLTLAAGTYTLTFDVGINDNGRPLIEASRRDFGFFDPDWTDGSGYSVTAGTSTNNSNYTRDALPAFLSDYTGLTKTRVSTVAPAENSWETWTLTYTVAVGSTAIGQIVDFGFFAVTPSGGGEIQLDNLAINFSTNPSGTGTVVIVDAGVQKGTISPYLMGTHTVYYNDLDAAYADGTLAAWVKNAGVGTMRFPGGSVVKYWDWESPSGTATGDPWDPNWDGVVANSNDWMSLDEYLDFCDTSGIKPLVGVNYRSGYLYDRVQDSIDRASNCVQHVVDRGYPGAFYYIGNEDMFEVGGVSSAANLFVQHAQAMKAVDPTIKIFWNDNGADPQRMKTYLAIAGEWADGYEFHGKWPFGGSPDPSPLPGSYEEWKTEVPLIDRKADNNSGKTWRQKITDLRQAADEAGYPNLLLADNEYGWGSGINYTGFNKFTMGLLQIDFLQEHFISGYDMACFWANLRNADNGLLDTTDNYRRNPQTLGWELLAVAQGATMVESGSSNPYVYGFTAKTTTNIMVYLLNKTESAQTIQIAFSSNPPDETQPASGVSVVDSADHFGAFQNIAIAYNAASNTYTATLPAMSYNRISFAKMPDPVVWLDASQGLGLVNEHVAAWTNRASPGTFNAVQASETQRPGLLYEAWAGHPVVHFDGVDDILTLVDTVGDPRFEGELTVFYVGRTTGGSFSGTGGFVGNFQTGTGYKNGWTLRTQSNGTYGFLFGNGSWNTVGGGTGLIGGDFVLLNARYSDDGDGTGTMELFSSLLEDPLTAGTNPFMPDSSSVDISIGMFCGWNSLLFNQPAGCDVAEIRIYDHALSDADRQTVWDELSAKYAVATEQPIRVEDFQPSGYAVPVGTPVQITFSEAMDAASITNVIVGVGGLDGLPESNAWVRVSGPWTASVSNTVFTFAPGTAFEPGDLVMCEIPTNVVSAGGKGYETSERETYSFMVDNGVSYSVTTPLIDPMAIVYHDNGDPHILPLKLWVPATDEPCPIMFWVHGGGWSGGDSGTWERSDVGVPTMGDYFSEKLGVAVAGVAWRSLANSEGTFSKAVMDIGLAIQYVIDHAGEYGIDTSRMGLYGGSAGTPTSALVAQMNTNISCYIGFNGLYDFINRVPPYGFGGGTTFAQDVPSLEANSAALNVRVNPPDTLLMHGSADTTIEHQQSLQYAARVPQVGGTSTALIYRDEVHAFFNNGKPMHLPTLYQSAKHLTRVFALGYGNWAKSYNLSGTMFGNDDNDALDNLSEYGMGGDPTDPEDIGIFPTFGIAGSGFEYVYPRRTTPGNGLAYLLETTDNLVSGIWTNAGYAETGYGTINDDFKAVTNNIPTLGKTTGFVRLKIWR